VGRFGYILGYKRLVVAGFIGTCLVFLGIQWAGNYLTFHILFFLLGITTGAYLPSIIPIITETYDYRHWGKAIGFHDSAASLSIFAIPILVAFGLRFFSWQQLLLILGIASLLLPIYFWKVSVEPKKEMPWSEGNYVDLFKKKKIWIMGLLWVFAAGSCLGIYSVLPLYLIKERGIELHFANTLFGYRRMLTVSLLATGLSTICLSAASTLPMILITLLLQATFSLAFFPVALVAISNFTSLSERSMATGVILSMGVIFGMGSTPFVLGVIADHFSFKVGILGLGVLTTLSSLAVGLLEDK
jgi:NNP family nitrate/nitrite transporter-like MFS transporter